MMGQDEGIHAQTKTVEMPSFTSFLVPYMDKAVYSVLGLCLVALHSSRDKHTRMRCKQASKAERKDKL